MVIPSWFKVGASTWFMGFGYETVIESIDEAHIDDKDCSWVGRDYDGLKKYPLDEVSKYWRPNHVDSGINK